MVAGVNALSIGIGIPGARPGRGMTRWDGGVVITTSIGLGGHTVDRLSSSIQGVSGAAVLTSGPGSVRIVVFEHGRLLLYQLCAGARARKGGAEEEVHKEHEDKENAEDNRQPQEPSA